MEREMLVKFGTVPHSLFEEPLPESSWQMDHHQFLLRAEADHFFHYRRGQGVTIDRGVGADVSEEALWLNGSVYAAVASLNGLLPIHASAVAYKGRVFAFTGPAGAGKSTLVAALGRRSLQMFCDDTLLLDLSDPDKIVCLPGHKRLKLTSEAIHLTGAKAEEKVSKNVDKYYAAASNGEARTALPLSHLLFLEPGKGAGILPITGAERFVRLQDDHYTSHPFSWARHFDRIEQFAHLKRLASQLRMARFVRPFDVSQFAEGADLAARFVISEGR
jgi:hypothetical protein